MPKEVAISTFFDINLYYAFYGLSHLKMNIVRPLYLL
jgi:hypothetical protein